MSDGRDGVIFAGVVNLVQIACIEVASLMVALIFIVSASQWHRTVGFYTERSHTGEMGQRGGVHAVVHRLFGGIRQYLEVPVYGVGERWRCVFDPIFDCAVPDRKAYLLPGDGDGTVL